MFKKTLLGFLVSISLFANYKPKASSYVGKASFYTNKTNKLNGHNKTANGEIFNENSLTCASNRHKFNTLLKVENLKNGKSVICRVNDRGGFSKYGRVIDLSKRSFMAISDIKNGIVKVRISVIKK